MNAQQDAVALFQFWEKRGKIISNAAIKKSLRAVGHTFNDRDVPRWLEAFRQHSTSVQPKSTEVAPSKTSTNTEFATEFTESAPRLRARNKEPLLSKSITTPNGVVSPLFPIDESRISVASKPVNPAKVVPGWVSPLRAAAHRIADVTLADLTVDERFTVARYHALKHCGCTKSEATNRTAAARLIPAIADLGRQSPFGALTVRDYFLALEVVAETTGTLVRSPWAIKAGLEFEVPA